MSYTRRDALVTGGGALVALTTLAGCVESGGQTDVSGTDTGSQTGTGAGTDAGSQTGTASGGTSTGGASERPATPNSSYATWLPAPDTLGMDAYGFTSVAPSALRSLAAQLRDGTTEAFDRQLPVPSIETLGDARAIHRFESVSVFEADFERSTVESGIEQGGFSVADTRHGFTILTAEDTRAAAVGDDAIVAAGTTNSSDASEKRPVVEAVVDARTGNADRFTDAVEDCDRLVTSLGNGHALFGGTSESAGPNTEGAVASGAVQHVGSEQTHRQLSVVFEAGSVDERYVADLASTMGLFSGREPTIATDGRVVTATVQVPTDSVTEFPQIFPGPRMKVDPPSVDFQFEYEASGDGAGVLTITHDGGHTVPATELYVRGSGFADVADVDQTSAGPWQGTTRDSDGGVAAGDAVDAGVASDYEISVVWEPADSDASTTLASDRGPDA